jgi:hypothetical protein
MAKPMILWSCDVKGWAYHNRIMRLSRVMPQYEHRVLMGECVPPSLHTDLVDRAAVIVCQGIKVIDRVIAHKSIHALPDPAKALERRYANLVCRLDSVRIDHHGEYFDIWKLKSPSSSG